MKIFRNDDINPNSNFLEIFAMYEIIRAHFPDARIISAVNLLSQTSEDGSAYAKLKPKDIDFAAVDRMMDPRDLAFLREHSEIASHGLAHLDHRAASADLQDLSIFGSCSILKCKIFVPPFLRFNGKTEQICDLRGIEFMGGIDAEKWVNLDNEPVRPDHDLFVFHSWKFTPATFAERFRSLST